MATYRKRGGRWRVEVCRNKRRASATRRTLAEAREWATQTEARFTGNRSVLARRSLSDALDKYAREVSPKKRGGRWEVIRLQRFQRELPFIGRMVDRITPAEIGEWRDQMLKRLKPGSVIRELTLLSAVFERARREWGWCNQNPVRDVTRPPQPPHRERIITVKEVEAMLAALGYVEGQAPETSDQQTAAAFLVALETAMRASEIVTLTADRVFLEQRYVKLTTSKTGHGREVPLTARAAKILELGLFTISAKTLDVRFREARKRAKLSGFTFHDARHTAITNLAQKLPVLDLARMTGHRNINQLRVYYNASAADIAKRLAAAESPSVV